MSILNGRPGKVPIAAQSGGGLTAAQVRRVERDATYIRRMDELVKIGQQEERGWAKLRRAQRAYEKARQKLTRALKRRDDTYRDLVRQELARQIAKEDADHATQDQEA